MDQRLQAEICARIKQARETAGFTQEEIADLLNMTPRGYQNYESVRVPFRRLGEIARITNVAESWLLHGGSPEQQMPEAQQALLRDVAAGVEQLERFAAEALSRLERIEDAVSPGEATQPG
jgi:transcriptional regulator with XRE-family HTH domain